MTENKILISNAHIYGPEEWQRGWLLIEGRTIAWMGPGDTPDFDPAVARQIDAAGQRLLPGFIDLHTHGAVGVEVMDGDPQGLRQMAQFFACHGVTAFLPTTWTASAGDIHTALASVGEVIGPVAGGATVLGAHLEGPYINPSRCGAQDAALIRPARRDEALGLLDTGLVRLITLAPEIADNLWLIDEASRRGVAVSAGHTNAGEAELREAARRGLRHITHCFNAMSGLDHRKLGTVGAALSIPTLHCELIADNIHVHPDVQRILVDVKKPAGVILVTDAVRGTGLADGEYPIDQRTITIKDGQARLPDGTLAGSVLTMERALANVTAAAQRPLSETWPMSSLNAAREIGVSARKGSLEVGKDADLVLLDADFEVVMTMAEGKRFTGAETRAQDVLQFIRI